MAIESNNGVRVPIGMRVPPEALETIDARARERKMTRTEYMIQSSLGQLDGLDLQVTPQLESLDARVARLEHALFGTEAAG